MASGREVAGSVPAHAAGFGRHVVCAFTVMLLLAAAAAASSPDATVQNGLRARDAGDYATAIRLFGEALAHAPDRTDVEILLAETLAWDKQFPEAGARYRRVLERAPSSREARLGLARVLLWSGKFVAARREFNALLATSSRDVDALEGRGTAEYWSGDFRSAARDFRRALQLDPGRGVSKRSLAEISAAAAPQERYSAGYVDDDQPYRVFRGDAAATIASDPLTRWTATAGTYRASAPIYGTATMPFIRLGNESTFPRFRLTASPSIGAIRYGDGVVRPTGALGLSFQLTGNSSAVAGFAREELLATATGLKSHPSVTTFHAGWRRESKDGWLAAADASILRYFDGNRGKAAYGYALLPLFSHGATHLLAGLSATYRDSSDSRFAFAAVSSTRIAPGLFDYAYRGTYAPYWAPQNLREARAILVARTAIRSTKLELHVDGGAARDRAVAFGPDSGSTPLPPFIYSFGFDRRFHPYRADVTASFPTTRGVALEIGFQSESTVFYREKSIHASVVRQR